MNKRSIEASPTGVCECCGRTVPSLSVAQCAECGGVIVPVNKKNRMEIGWFSLPEMLYQQEYVWFVFISVLDILLTWIILGFGGNEVNVIADSVIAQMGAPGIIIYKFCLVVFVVLNCEIIGRRRPVIGRKLAEWSIAITAIPVVLSLVQLFTHS